MTVFSFLEVLVGVGILAGSLIAPALVAIFGARAALVLAGAILPALALVTWRPLLRLTVDRPVYEERIALLRRDPLFAPLPLTALDLLAERMTPASYAPGAALMRKGERGLEYILLASGTVEVTDEDRVLGTAGPGEGVGEIALLYDVPRTATVVATTEVEAFSIDAQAFLEAMTGPTAAALAERIASRRLGHSLPTA